MPPSLTTTPDAYPPVMLWTRSHVTPSGDVHTVTTPLAPLIHARDPTVTYPASSAATRHCFPAAHYPLPGQAKTCLTGSPLSPEAGPSRMI